MKKTLFALALSPSLLAMDGGSFTQYQEGQHGSERETLRKNYQYPLLKEIQAPIEEKKPTLQQQVVDYFGTFVTSSPYPGVRANCEANELISSLPNINKDLQILLALKEATDFLKKSDIPYPENLRIFMSGKIEFTGMIQRDATAHCRSDLDLTGTELDFLTVIAPWLYGFISIEYENSVSPAISNSRFANSRIKGESIFITFGDFTCSPWYATIGQTYLPYGQYSTYDAIHDPLTTILFRTTGRDVALGFFNDFLQTALFVFKGDSHAGSGNNMNNYGLNLEIHYAYKDFDGKIGGGLIRNIADSNGMQAVFGDSANNEKLRHVVPGINAHFNFTWKSWNLIGEYNQGLRSFDVRDAAFSSNGTTFKGARPRAMDVELAYSFNTLNRPSSLALSYSRSWESLGFNIPKERITLTWTCYIFRGNLLSLELNSDKLYDKKNRAAGNIVPKNPYFINPKNLGHRDYSFGIDYLFYF
ncbi:MAG: LbtU family siderophore porin [Candidatus Neptunochlamydia sp.]|nr:LbtU family siderophore porin [Candidatus Neptunochlamydia sp.]